MVTMSRYLPTIRGWVAFLLTFIAKLLYPGMLPPHYSTLGHWQAREPVSTAARIIGVVLIFICVAACVEAFRRGSRPDRVVTCVAVLFTLGLVYEFLKAFFYAVN